MTTEAVDSKAKKFTKSSVFDRLGIVCSTACLMHCFAAPILILFSPTLAASFHNEALHTILLLLVIPFALLAFMQGYRVHQDTLAMKFGISGLVIMMAAYIFEHQLSELQIDLVFNTLGGLLLISGHVINLKRNRACCLNQCQLDQADLEKA